MPCQYSRNLTLFNYILLCSWIKIAFYGSSSSWNYPKRRSVNVTCSMKWEWLQFLSIQAFWSQASHTVFRPQPGRKSLSLFIFIFEIFLVFPSSSSGFSLKFVHQYLAQIWLLVLNHLESCLKENRTQVFRCQVFLFYYIQLEMVRIC